MGVGIGGGKREDVYTRLRVFSISRRKFSVSADGGEIHFTTSFRRTNGFCANARVKAKFGAGGGGGGGAAFAL